MFHHIVEGLAPGRHLPGADGVDGLGDVAEGIGHAGKPPRGPAEALGRGRGRRRREHRPQPFPRQGQRRAAAQPRARRQGQHPRRVGGGQRAQRAARREHPRAAPALAGVQAGGRQAAQGHGQRRMAQPGAGRRQGRRKGDAEHRRLLQCTRYGRAQPRRRGQRQARSPGPGGKALQAGHPHGQQQAGPPRLLRRELYERPAEPRRQQGGTPRGGQPGRVRDAPGEKKFQRLHGQQRQAAGQRPRAGPAAAQPPPRHSGCQRPRQPEAHRQRLKDQAGRQRARARREQIPRRAADDQRQPERRGPAVDLPGPQHQPRARRGPLPQQRRGPRPRGQQRPGVRRRKMQIFPCKHSHVSFPLYVVCRTVPALYHGAGGGFCRRPGKPENQWESLQMPAARTPCAEKAAKKLPSLPGRKRRDPKRAEPPLRPQKTPPAACAAGVWWFCAGRQCAARPRIGCLFTVPPARNIRTGIGSRVPPPFGSRPPRPAGPCRRNC